MLFQKQFRQKKQSVDNFLSYFIIWIYIFLCPNAASVTSEPFMRKFKNKLCKKSPTIHTGAGWLELNFNTIWENDVRDKKKKKKKAFSFLPSEQHERGFRSVCKCLCTWRENTISWLRMFSHIIDSEIIIIIIWYKNIVWKREDLRILDVIYFFYAI